MPDRFAFDDDRYQRLLEVLGRADAPAQAYLADLEALARAFPLLMEPATAGGLPSSVVVHLSEVSRAARDLQRQLYELPADARDLLALHLISEATGQTLQADLRAMEEPLGELVRICRNLIAEGPDRLIDSERVPAERLILIAARAYRNHFNVNVHKEPAAEFEHSLALMLDALAANGHQSATALQERLPALCRKLLSGGHGHEPQ